MLLQGYFCGNNWQPAGDFFLARGVQSQRRCAFPWGWWNKPPCCYDVNNALGTSNAVTAIARGGGEWKGSIDDCSKDNIDGDKMDSGGGNAAGNKEGTPLKCKG